jgi:hypothetical protein
MARCRLTPHASANLLRDIHLLERERFLIFDGDSVFGLAASKTSQQVSHFFCVERDSLFYERFVSIFGQTFFQFHVKIISAESY